MPIASFPKGDLVGAKENKVQNVEKILINHFASALMANKGHHKNKSRKNNVECFLASAHNAYQDLHFY